MKFQWNFSDFKVTISTKTSCIGAYNENYQFLNVSIIYFQKDEFQMYSIYCANKPRSEELHNAVGNNNPFFKVSQRK